MSLTLRCNGEEITLSSGDFGYDSRMDHVQGDPVQYMNYHIPYISKKQAEASKHFWITKLKEQLGLEE